MTEPEAPFWERPETVERFSGRDPDLRLQELVGEYADPGRVRFLDLGCAGGRNTVYLAERGFDVTAVDGSEAMVAETRGRLAAILGREEAEARVRHGRMDRLEFLPDGSVDFVVALGVLHCAGSEEEWDQSLREVARVLRGGGRALVANHTPEFDPDGSGVVRLPGDAPLYRRRSGHSYLVDADGLDREFAKRGLTPEVPSETVRRETDEGGVRVVVNALYVKARGREGEGRS